MLAEPGDSARGKLGSVFSLFPSGEGKLSPVSDSFYSCWQREEKRSHHQQLLVCFCGTYLNIAPVVCQVSWTFHVSSIF